MFDDHSPSPPGIIGEAPRSPLQATHLGAAATSPAIVELGRPANWRRALVLDPERMQQDPGPVALTESEDWIALYLGDTLIGAAPRMCPHRGKDLVRFGRYHDCPGVLQCKHTGFGWLIRTGKIWSTPPGRPTRPIDLRPIRLRDDGRAYVVLDQVRVEAA